MTSLPERIQAKAPELARRAVAELYQNPFWQQRLGDNGREMLGQDGQAHLPCLVQALVASDALVLARYARELQTLLVSRGMCSRHIDESFQRLARAIRDELSEAEPALELLLAARAALIYESGLERELMLGAEALADCVVDALWSRQPSWFSAASSYPSLATFESIHRAERARCRSDVLDYIAYLADALHAQRPELFVAHAVWMQEFVARRQLPGARVEETLLALSDCLPAAPTVSGASCRPGAAASGGTHLCASEAASSQPPLARRPPLSQPPPPPVPVPASPELAAAAQAMLAAAREALEANRQDTNAAKEEVS